MARIIRLTESDLTRIVKRVINEQSTPNVVYPVYSKSQKKKVGVVSKQNGFIPDKGFESQFPADKRGLKMNGDLYVSASKKGISGGSGQFYYR